MATSKSIFSEPIAVLSTKGVDVSRTYGHLYILNPNNNHQYQCKLCLRVASLLERSKDPRAPEARKRLKAYLNCTRKSHIVDHLASVHPEHLVEDCNDQMILTALNKGETSSVVPNPINELVDPSVILDTLDFTLWLLEDMHPFSIVEDVGFKKMIACLNNKLRTNQKIKLPSVDEIVWEASRIDEVLREFLRSELSSQGGRSEIDTSNIIATDSSFSLLSFTLDAWTSIFGNPFLGVTVHSITNEFEMRSYVLALRHFKPPHTSTAYKQVFESILAEYGLGTHTALSVTTDSASVMQKMMDETDLPHSRCMAHSLNQAIQADTFDKPQFKSLIENPIKLAGFFSSSASIRRIVQEKAKELGIEYTVVKLDVTRWSCIYHMLNAHLQTLPVIIRLSGKRLGIEPPAKQDEFDRLVTLCIHQQHMHMTLVEILEPIMKWARLLQSSTSPTMSLVFEARSDILAHLHPLATDEVTEMQLRAHLKAAIEYRFDEFLVPINLPAQVPETNPNCRKVENIRTRWQMTNCAALLDIRTAYQHLRTAPMQDVGNRDTLIRYIASSVNLSYPGRRSSESGEENSSLSNHLGIWKDLKKDMHINRLVSVVGDELKLYVAKVVSLNTPPGSVLPADLPLDERLKRNPLTFWKEYKNEFPNLSIVARSMLGIQASASAASERIFSNPGFTGNPRRNRVSVDSLEICTLVRDALAENIDLKQRVKERRKEKNEEMKKKRSVIRSARKKRREDVDVGDGSCWSGNEDEDGEIGLTSGEEESVIKERMTNDRLAQRKLMSKFLEGEEDEAGDAGEADGVVEEQGGEWGVSKHGAKIILDDEDEDVGPVDLDVDVSR
jgi:hAT family C-terminal dimerisation region